MHENQPPRRGLDPRDDGYPPRGRSMVRLVASILLALAAALALYLLQPSWFSAPAAAPPPPVQTPVPTPTPRPRPPSYPYLGEGQRMDNVVITPLSVTYTKGAGDSVANKGDVYAIVTIRFVNHSGKDFNLVPNVNCALPYCYFYVLDSQGEKNPPVNYDPLHTRLRPVVLQDNGREEGTLTFEVPEADARAQTLELLYYHDPVLDAGNVKHWRLRPPPAHGR